MTKALLPTHWFTALLDLPTAAAQMAQLRTLHLWDEAGPLLLWTEVLADVFLTAQACTTDR